MAPGAKARCPTCKKPVPAAAGERPPDFPFCSERCRLVDLHRWLTGQYVIPGPEVAAPEEPEERKK